VCGDLKKSAGLGLLQSPIARSGYETTSLAFSELNLARAVQAVIVRPPQVQRTFLAVSDYINGFHPVASRRDLTRTRP
jgi:hypothetical protein